MFVGVGPPETSSDKQREHPCVIFIDEIDAIGAGSERASGATMNANRPSTSSSWKWMGSTPRRSHHPRCDEHYEISTRRSSDRAIRPPGASRQTDLTVVMKY